MRMSTICATYNLFIQWTRVCIHIYIHRHLKDVHHFWFKRLGRTVVPLANTHISRCALLYLYTTISLDTVASGEACTIAHAHTRARSIPLRNYEQRREMDAQENRAAQAKQKQNNERKPNGYRRYTAFVSTSKTMYMHLYYVHREPHSWLCSF